MNIATLDTYIILFVVSIISYLLYQQYNEVGFDKDFVNVKSDSLPALLAMFAIALLIGLRPIYHLSGFGDSVNYRYSYFLNEGHSFSFNPLAKNLIWDNLFLFWASKRFGISSLFLLCDLLYFGFAYLACRKWFPKDTLAAFVVFCGAFSTLSYSYNGIKAGLAASFFLVALAYYEEKWLSIILVLVSWGFHHSMQLPVAAYLLTMFFKDPKLYFYGWFFAVIMAVLHVSFFQGLFASMSDETGESYLSTTEEFSNFGGKGGFRIDFLLYSAVPVWIGYNFVMKEQRKVSNLYLVLLNMYLCTNAVWMLCMYASYTNRIAYLSWFMYPFVLIYPFLKEDLSDSFFLNGRGQYQMFAKVLAYHLGFTLFMSLIFYKFIK